MINYLLSFIFPGNCNRFPVQTKSFVWLSMGLYLESSLAVLSDTEATMDDLQEASTVVTKLESIKDIRYSLLQRSRFVYSYIIIGF